jgi:hypothetical protein
VKEKGYAFERQITNSLIIHHPTKITWVHVEDNKVDLPVEVNIKQTVVLPRSEFAPSSPPTVPTLFIPEDPEQPIYDLLSVDGSTIINNFKL